MVENSICNCDPSKPSETGPEIEVLGLAPRWDVLSKERMVKDDKGEVKTKVIDCPFIELPTVLIDQKLARPRLTPVFQEKRHDNTISYHPKQV